MRAQRMVARREDERQTYPHGESQREERDRERRERLYGEGREREEIEEKHETCTHVM